MPDTAYPFVTRAEACEVLRCSLSTLRRRMKSDLLKDVHWVQRGRGQAILFNQRLLEDYVAHLRDPDAHLEAIEAYKAHLQQNRPPRRCGLKRA
ncbi:MAG: hypothetical protein AAGG53_04550 [Cyanobacteria bacterium P01_H01_bin.152]